MSFKNTNNIIKVDMDLDIDLDFVDEDDLLEVAPQATNKKQMRNVKPETSPPKEKPPFEPGQNLLIKDNNFMSEAYKKGRAYYLLKFNEYEYKRVPFFVL